METATARTFNAAGRWWLPIAVFLAAVVTFVVFYHKYFTGVWVPLADSASNAMLVLDAKHFALLHGNYSRVGFYHPGPHLFYLMAAGEYLFHDLLGVAKSPEAAQQLAVICLSIVILQIVERVYRDLAGDVLISLCATAATALCVVAKLPEAFTSVWVPHTYITAGLLFFVGGAALAAGRFRWLWVFVLGSALLVSGHASFLGLVPMMGLAFVCASVALHPKTRSLSGLRTLAADHRASVIASAVIVAILVLPMILDFALHFPGQFPKYFEFAGKQPRKGWLAVLYVLLPYWKFAGVAGLLLLAGYLSAPAEVFSDRPRMRIAAGALAVFAAGTAAVIFYLQKGVDVIADHSLYLVWWYQAVPATCVGLAVVYVGTTLTRRLPLLAVLLVLVSAAFWFVRWPLPGADDRANIENAFEVLQDKSRSSGRPVRIALDVKNELFFDTWARTIGLIAEQERRGGGIVCLEDYHWHISYHGRNRCAPANPNEVQIRLVAAYEDLAPIGGRLVATFMGLRLYDIKPADWPLDRIRNPWVGLSDNSAKPAPGSTGAAGTAVR
jgi:hypothetical protein